MPSNKELQAQLAASLAKRIEEAAKRREEHAQEVYDRSALMNRSIRMAAAEYDVLPNDLWDRCLAGDGCKIDTHAEESAGET